MIETGNHVDTRLETGGYPALVRFAPAPVTVLEPSANTHSHCDHMIWFDRQRAVAGFRSFCEAAQTYQGARAYRPDVGVLRIESERRIDIEQRVFVAVESGHRGG